MMSSSQELGISPALLQAITHLNTTRVQKPETPEDASTYAGEAETSQASDILVSQDPVYQQIFKVQGGGAQSIEGLSNVISAMGNRSFQTFQAGNTVFVLQDSPAETVTVSSGDPVQTHVSPAPILVRPKVEHQPAQPPVGLSEVTIPSTNSYISAIASQASVVARGGRVSAAQSLPSTPGSPPRIISNVNFQRPNKVVQSSSETLRQGGATASPRIVGATAIPRIISSGGIHQGKVLEANPETSRQGGAAGVPRIVSSGNFHQGKVLEINSETLRQGGATGSPRPVSSVNFHQGKVLEANPEIVEQGVATISPRIISSGSIPRPITKNVVVVPKPKIITPSVPQSRGVIVMGSGHRESNGLSEHQGITSSSAENIPHVENVVTETVVQTSFHQENSENISPPEPKKLKIVEVQSVDQNTIENGSTIILNHGGVGDGVVYKAITTDQGTVVYRTVNTVPSNNGDMTHTVMAGDGLLSLPPELAMGCPVCGDRVSGYHYGIYSCESCKGFFKRTVQNKKAFICHRMGECMVSMVSRKKCPACRFKQCLVAGMKLEAIREDRTRGGRSSYSGCSPHKPLKLPKERKPPAPVTPSQPHGLVSPIVIQTTDGHMAIASTSGSYTPSMSIPRERTPKPIAPKVLDLSQIQPQTPQLLEDLMAVESLMMEDEGEQACCEGKMVDGDPNLFSSLLHFADHCLYKIVRWARNLPDFACVSTDDQIVLLQNCWAELLCLCCCWKSVRCPPGVIRLCHGRTVNLEQAAAMGVTDMVLRLLDFTDSLRQLEVDSYEFVTLKALLLLSPDVRSLKDELMVRRYQDKLIESLMIYTTTNSMKKPRKFSELLARLPELTRSCVMGKDQLTSRQVAGEVPQYSLLSELLKGDIAVA